MIKKWSSLTNRLQQLYNNFKNYSSLMTDEERHSKETDLLRSLQRRVEYYQSN